MTLPPITTPATPITPQRPDAPRPMFSALAIAATGLSAQRVRMDVIAQNIANAETTRTPEGGPYQRHIVNFAAIAPEGAATDATSATTPGTAPTAAVGGTAQPTAAPSITAPAATSPGPLSASDVDGPDVTGGVRVASIAQDATPGPLVYDPASPDADSTGYVRMPNVNMTDELMDMMNARRIYEANATVFQVARAMLHKAIDI
ncbi:MAG TPA: flagellar basal body rod protein FlgC [Gemmatimonadaceae bacterium]|nr:flagellar basal body rod protein FlgC [Gemmatimonadaceae bacterium]